MRFTSPVLTLAALWVTLLISLPTDARTFTPVGTSKGLDARVAVAMVFGQQGYLWVGSREGLFRYDGYEATAYLPDAGNPNSLSDSDIRYVYQADNGDIWVGTNTGGLNQILHSTGDIVRYRHDSANPTTLLDDNIYGISEDAQGFLWVSTQQGVSRLDITSGDFTHYRHDANDPRSLSHNWGFYLHRGLSGHLWISTVGGGINRWIPERKDFERFNIASLTSGSPARNDVFSIHETADGRLWLGTRDGLVVLDPEANSASVIPMEFDDGALPIITWMAADSRDQLWLATMLRGILIVDTQSGEWEPANASPLGSAGNLPDQPQMSLAINDDQLFVGTWGSGVYKAPAIESAFGLLNRQTTDDRLHNNTISSVLAGDKPGEPWVGTFGGGPQLVNIFDSTTVDPVKEGRTLPTEGVMDMLQASSGQWYAATTAGLYRFDPQGTEVAHYPQEPDNPAGLGAGYVNVLLGDKSRGLWVGSTGSGLHYFDFATQTFTRHPHNPDQADSISGDSISALLRATDDQIWVGTRSNGLNLCRVEPFSCQRFNGDPTDANALSHHHVTSLYQDRRGRVWVSTAGGGINQIQMTAQGEITGFKRWGASDGLLNDEIMAIEEDLDESLWLSTRHGLSRINTATGTVINFVADSGLPVSHFNINASAADDDYIYFGSVDGLLSIRKGSLLKERNPPDLLITKVQRAARGEQPQPVTHLDSPVIVPHGEIVTVEFAVMDFSESAHDYAYRLSATDEWTQLGSQRQIIFHGIAPGSYQFQARGRDVWGQWGESHPVELDIIPPFWITTWFRALLVVLLVIGGLLLHKGRTGRIRRSALESQRLSERREAALEGALKEAKGSDAELANLTPRQKEILQLVAEGYSTREIADLLNVSIKTVEAHRANLMQRLDIHDVPGLVKLAIRANLVSPDE